MALGSGAMAALAEIQDWLPAPTRQAHIDL